MMWDEAVYSTSTGNSTAIDLLGGKRLKNYASTLCLVIAACPIYRRDTTISFITILRMRTRHARVARDL